MKRMLAFALALTLGVFAAGACQAASQEIITKNDQKTIKGAKEIFTGDVRSCLHSFLRRII